MIDKNDQRLISAMESKEQMIWLWIVVGIIMMISGMLMDLVLARQFPLLHWKSIFFSLVGIWVTACGLMVIGALAYQLRLLRLVKKLEAMAKKAGEAEQKTSIEEPSA